MPEKINFVVNPISGTQQKVNIVSLIYKHIDREKYQIKISYTEYPGHAAKIAQKSAKKDMNIVVAVGGDGTVNEVASGIINTKTALAIIPTGSGNGLARHLGIPMKIEEAIKSINTAQTTRIDYGLVNGIPFFCTSGVGFDAKVGKMFAKNKKRGFLAYAKTVTREFQDYKPRKYIIEADGDVFEKEAFLITIANSSQFGNNAYVSPHAKINDGLFDVTIISPFPKPKVIGLGIRLFRKSIDKSNYVETITCKQITIKRKKKGIAHYDGEPVKLGKKLTFKIVPRGLLVLAPGD